MILPAWLDLMDDRHVTPAGYQVWRALFRHNPRIFFEPVPVKVTVLARQLKVHRNTVAGALNLLVQRRYVVESERGQRGVRRVTLALSREP